MNASLKPQDILVLLQILTLDESWTQAQLAEAVQISAGEVSNSISRCVTSGLLSETKRVNRLALREFLIAGVKYAFPAQISTKVRGIATAHSASPIVEQIAAGEDGYVWKHYLGTKRGLGVSPLYKSVTKIVGHNSALYELLVIVDTLRIGKVREVEIAVAELDKRLGNGK